LIIAADRGMAGAYSNAAIKEGDIVMAALQARGITTDAYLVGRKAVNYYKFRNRAIAGSWTGFSDNPQFAHAREVSAALINAFLAAAGENKADELHVIYTQFKSMITQLPVTNQVLPLQTEAAQKVCFHNMNSNQMHLRCSMHFFLDTSKLESSTRCCNQLLPSMLHVVVR